MSDTGAPSGAGAGAPGQGPAGPDDGGLIRAVRALLDLLGQTQVSEIEVAWGDTTIMARRAPGAAGALAAHVEHSAAAAAGIDALAADGATPILSPLTGVYYLTPSPSAPPYVREGDAIERDQVVGLVEAMKIFNEIRSEVAGVVVKLLTQSGDLVQMHQPLMLVRPSGTPAMDTTIVRP
jgi:biotin carboxyl carrier protein